MKLKEMIDEYARSGLSEKTWVHFYLMMDTGRITKDKWIKFRDTCCDWYIEEDEIRDQYDDPVYRLDSDGNWKKVE